MKKDVYEEILKVLNEVHGDRNKNRTDLQESLSKIKFICIGAIASEKPEVDNGN